MRKIWWTWMLAGLLMAQDVHFTQMYSSPMWLNPAMTGFFSGCYRFGVIGRMQWSTVMEAYKTAAFYGDARLLEDRLPRGDALGAGLLLYTDRAGDAPFIINMASVSGSYHKSLGDHFIAAGFQVAVVNKQLGTGTILFPNQYVEGVGMLATVPHGERIYRSITYPDFNVGVLAYGRVSDYLSYYGGAAYFHILQPEEKFILTSEEGYRYPSRIVVHGGLSITSSDYVRIIPNFVFMYQGGAMDILPGATMEYTASDNLFYTGGLYYRYGDALALTAGMGIGPVAFGVSSDFNIGPLSNISRASRGWGGIEFTIRYTGVCYRLRFIFESVPCPRI